MKNEPLIQLFIEFAPRELWGAIVSLQGNDVPSAVSESEVVYHLNNLA